MQLKSTLVLHRVSHRFFTCSSHVIASKPQFGQHRRDLQRLRDRLGTLNPDGVAPEVEGSQDRLCEQSEMPFCLATSASILAGLRIKLIA